MKKQKIWGSLHPFYEAGAMLGRIEANRCFLRALLTADPFDAYHFFLPLPADIEYLEAQLREDFLDIWNSGRFVLRLRREISRAFAEDDYYCMHLSDPFTCYSEVMIMRNSFSRRIFPLTAPTHSLSYAEYGADFLKHIWPGTTVRDVVVSSSRAGKKVVENYYAGLQEHYRQGTAPAVRHIPLGVEPNDLPGVEDKARLGKAARERFALGDDLLFLVFARISYQSKMDLLPILRAFKRAESLGMDLAKSRLVLAGWVSDGDGFPDDIQKLAANLGIQCSIVPRPDHEERKGLYAAADVFLSPSDNLQETFGLTMLEAALSGLPVIASDFDGYKDLVEHGVSGFLIPSYGPDATLATDVLSTTVPASEYHLLLAQQCVVDVKKMGEAIYALSKDACLRSSMGGAGRARVLGAYTWSAVLKQYIALWDELNSTPCPLDGPAQARPVSMLRHPLHPSFMNIFGDYFSSRLGSLVEAGSRAVWTNAGEAVYRGRDFPVIYRLIEDRIDMERLRKILFMARKPVALESLLLELNKNQSAGLSDSEFMLLWAIKHDFLEVLP